MKNIMKNGNSSTNSGNIDIKWHMPLNICVGVTHGLHYLHVLIQPKIIHRNIKASNILLDKDFVPKIVDFGIVLLFPKDKTQVTTINIASTNRVYLFLAHHL